MTVFSAVFGEPNHHYRLDGTASFGTGVLSTGPSNKVTVGGTAGRAYIRLHLRQGVYPIIATTFSNAAGDFVFKGLDKSQQYLITAFEPTSTYNAIILDQLTPV